MIISGLKKFIVVNFFISFFVSSSDVKPQTPEQGIQVMLLGVYHFDNPGRDKHNLVIDDYFTDKRQEEINETVNRLSKFNPDKIFIESQPTSQKKIDSLYLLFTENKLNLTELERGRNEIYQIGFNLSKKLNLEKIYCIDAAGNWLGPYADFIADTLSLSYYNEEEEKSKKSLEEVNEYIRTHTIRENLVFMNLQENLMDNHRYYIDAALRVKDTLGILFKYQDTAQMIDGKEYMLRSFDFENIGVELVAEWYKRNFFIYRNILENSNAGDKILIIFGQGHLPILQHLLESNPKYKTVSPLDFL